MNAQLQTPTPFVGLIKGMPMGDYHAVDALSSAGLRLLARSAWHYRHRVDVVPTRPMLNGTLVHAALLEPEAMAERYVVVPADAPKRPTEAQWNAKKSNESSQAAKEWWMDFGEQVAGRTIVAAEDYSITQAQLAAVAACPELAEILSRGYSEASVFAIDEATGLYCRARPDWVHPIDSKRVKLLDLKSTADESPSGFGRTAARMKYHLQQAHYIDVFERATGMEVVEFVFAAVSSATPVLAVPYLLPAEFAEQGVDECRELRELLARCKREDVWPSYGTGSGYQLAEVPAYAMRSSEVEVSYIED